MTRYICTLCLLPWLLASSLLAQPQLAQDTHAIFQAACLNCHGTDGAFRETLLMEHSELIDGGSVVPGNPDASELYKRLLGPTDNGVQMPFGQPPLPPQSIDTVRRWILAGAPDWTPTPTDHQFIAPGAVLTTIERHLASLSTHDRTFARYFTLTHLYNSGEPPAILSGHRDALYKLINSLSWGFQVINPTPIDRRQTIFYIDLRHYEWDRNDAWTQIETAYPYHISLDAPDQQSLKNQLTRLQNQMECQVPAVHIDWFIANAATPPLYYDLLSLPLTDRELETRLEVDVAQNLLNAPGFRVWRAGFNDSGVSNNNRVVERHTSRYGAYWKSYDFAGSVGAQNIFTHPLAFTHDGGEIIFNLPNGLQAYYLSNASGFRLDDAPINIVSNPAASDPTVRNGISCIGCHTEGMKAVEDEVRTVIQNTRNPAYDRAHALRLYVPKPDMDALVAEDMNRYRTALEATGGTFDGVEPVSRFHEAFQAPVDAAYAAAVVGLQTDTFLERVRENTGLQNVGLLALDNPNGSVKRDTWTSSFRDIISALDYPDRVGEPPVITQPDVLPGGHVHIPDSNLRALIAETLGKSINDPITVEEMNGLRRIADAYSRGIRDLTGLQYAINLSRLVVENDQVSDISPIAGLINLKELSFENNPVSDLSPVRGLINLTWLEFDRTKVSDLSPVRGLINLTSLEFHDTLASDLSPVRDLTSLTRLELSRAGVSDLSPVAGLINLVELHFSGNHVSDLSPIAGLINLKSISTWGNPISDLSPLAGLTKLERLDICGARLEAASLAPLGNLTGLKELYLVGNGISDISPLAGLTGLERLNLRHNHISDVSALAGLTKLKWMDVSTNVISDFSPLDRLRENTNIVWYDNTGFPQGGTKIEGPWLWVVVPGTRLDESTDLLAEASGRKVTEERIATHGATEGKPVGDDVWTSHKIAPTGANNLDDMLGRPTTDDVVYGTLSIYSPWEQETTMYVGFINGGKVWLNGTPAFERLNHRWTEGTYTDFFPVTLRQGRNVLLVAVAIFHSRGEDNNAFFGFEPGTNYSVKDPVIGYVFSKTPIHVGDTFTLDVRAENVIDLAGWQFDIAFDPALLEAVGVSEGDFLKANGGSTFFQKGRIDNGSGKITGLSAALLSDRGVTGSGNILHVTFKAKAAGNTEIALQKFQFGSIHGEEIPAGPHEINFTVEERLATGDVNRDGVVSILDLILVARQLGKNVARNSPEDINGDGVVNIFDLTLVASKIGATAAPAVATDAVIASWIEMARLEDDGSIAYRHGIENLQRLLASLIPQETALHANYPNPFNPETWIPYQLAESAEVSLTIYDRNGEVVRTIYVGHQPSGIYTDSSRAIHWDGENAIGEQVGSGLYFYHLRAGDYSRTRRMLIIK